MTQPGPAPTRRDLLAKIGAVAGGSAMYLAMTRLGFAQESDYAGPIKLDGDPKGASVLVLGAGIAGLVAALELRRAGYAVQVVEYNARAGGRTWSLRGGDRYTELGGAVQDCRFADGLYINPGPWRIPYHHRGLLDYCRRLGVALEPFIQVNHNAWLHSHAAGGAKVRYREAQADFNGAVAELLAKAIDRDRLGGSVTLADSEMLLDALQDWGALGADHAYRIGYESSSHRGWRKPPGGGLSAEPEFSQPARPADTLHSGVWRALSTALDYDYQTTLFQPVGGMDMIARAFTREVGDLIRYEARVTEIRQDDSGVSATYRDTRTGESGQARADWCLCTIPLSILGQIEMNVGPAMRAAIEAVPYAAALKIGLQFRSRFWEREDAIYGGISYTDLPISMIGYPNTGYLADGPAVLLGAYAFGAYATEFTSLDPAERVRQAVAFGAQIHPRYADEFEHGIAVGWHRAPFSMGCFGQWSSDARRAHYRDLCALDGRILLAGEHASYIPAWQEGAVLSSLDAIGRLHQRVMGA